MRVKASRACAALMIFAANDGVDDGVEEERGAALLRLSQREEEVGANATLTALVDMCAAIIRARLMPESTRLVSFSLEDHFITFFSRLLFLVTLFATTNISTV